MGKKCIWIMVFVFMFAGLSAQHEQENSNVHSKDHGKWHKHEIGISAASAWTIGLPQAHAAVHIEYLYHFPNTKFGIGVGAERMFGEHRHNFGGIELTYRPIHALSLVLSPGWSFESGHRDDKYFAMHFIAGYGFELGGIHLGPALEAAFEPKTDDWIISLGVHAGFGF